MTYALAASLLLSFAFIAQAAATPAAPSSEKPWVLAHRGANGEPRSTPSEPSVWLLSIVRTSLSRICG